MNRLISLSEAARRVGKPQNFKLVKALAAAEKLPVGRVGTAIAIRESDLPRLAAAVRRWDDRPRLSRMGPAPIAG